MSKGPEANFWNTLKKNLPSKCKAWRIENRVGTGLPDVYLIWDGVPFWLELKITNSCGVRITPTQVAWHTSHSHCGGVSFILVKHQGTGVIYLFEGSQSRELASEGLSCEPNLYMGKALGPMFEALRSCALSVMTADRGS